MIERRYRTVEDYKRGFEIGPDILRMFQNKAKDAKVDFDEDQYNECLYIFKTQLKATIARLIWGMNAYYQIIQELDETIQRAVKYIETGQ
jgi:carboxyl-terminal processing protease